MHYVIKNGYGKYWDDGGKTWGDKWDATHFNTQDEALTLMHNEFSINEIANFVVVPV